MASSSAAWASNPAMPKKKTPNQLMLANHPGGPYPQLGGKYRTSTHFRKMYRSYQWLQGYDLRVAEETPTSIRLVCATHPTCTFDITARKRELRANEFEPPAEGQSGWSPKVLPRDKAREESDEDYEAHVKQFEERIKANFAARTTHNHAAPYIPLNEADENERRAKLQPGDPSLENPPLVPVIQGFAGDDDSDDAMDIVTRAGAGFARSVGSCATLSASPVGGGSGSNRYSPPHPSPSSSQPHAVYQTGPAAGPATFPHATHVGAPAAVAGTTGPMPAQAQAKPLGVDVTGRPLSAAAAPPLPFQGAAIASGSAYSAVGAAAPFRQPSQSASTSSHKLSQLQQFLLEISPAFKQYFENFDEVLPLDTSVDRLLKIDTDANSSAVFELFLEIPELPLFLAVMAADGVRKAKIRQAKNPSSAKLNPKIAIGIEKVEAEQWLQKRIKVGQAILEQEAAAAV